MAGEFDDIRGRLEGIAEELADLAIDRLRESIDAGGTELPVDERRLTRARRAVEKAACDPPRARRPRRLRPDARDAASGPLRASSAKRLSASMSVAQAPVGEAVEVQDEARQVDVVVVRDLGRQRGGGLDVARRADVGELLVEPGQLLVGGRGAQPDDQPVADVADRVVVAVEAGELVDRGVDVVGDAVERGVVGVDQPACRDLARRSAPTRASRCRPAPRAARSARARPCRSAAASAARRPRRGCRTRRAGPRTRPTPS